VIESSLHNSLTEHLNAEITLSTIRTLDDAVTWLKSTFLSVRVRKNPQHYGLSLGPNLSEQLKQVCLHHLEKLDENHIIVWDRSTGSIQSTDLGISMARSYLKMGTVNSQKICSICYEFTTCIYFSYR
jgi:replicative superfamily II helicase